MSGELIKMVAVIIVCAVLITMLKTRLGEYSILISLAAISVVLITIFGNLFGIIADFKQLFKQAGNAGVYFAITLKALGISYIVSFAADTCRDYGLSALAQSVEIAGKITIFALSIPIITSVLEMALTFAKS